MNVKEISDNVALCALVWSWHRRRPGFNPVDGITFADMLGEDWHHFLFWFDGRPQVCVTANERRPNGYEIHVAVAEGTNPARTIEAVGFVGDRLMENPACRLASWCPATHRAAVRLNKHFLNFETSKDINGETWSRYGSSSPEWWEKHGQRIENAAASV